VLAIGALAAAGCASETMVRGMPAARARPAAYTYRPLNVEAPKPVAPPPEVAEIQMLTVASVPALPPHEASWDPPAAKRAWRYIVIHHSASRRGSAAAIDAWHRNGNHWDELGYHFVIGNGTGSGDGQIEVGSRWPKQKHGAHCKVGNDETYNETGIGICLVGDFEHGRPSAAQMAALARLVNYLAARYHVSDDHIIGHGDVDSTRCPGRNFSFSDLRARLRTLRAQRG